MEFIYFVIVLILGVVAVYISHLRYERDSFLYMMPASMDPDIDELVDILVSQKYGVLDQKRGRRTVKVICLPHQADKLRDQIKEKAHSWAIIEHAALLHEFPDYEGFFINGLHILVQPQR